MHNTVQNCRKSIMIRTLRTGGKTLWLCQMMAVTLQSILRPKMKPKNFLFFFCQGIIYSATWSQYAVIKSFHQALKIQVSSISALLATLSPRETTFNSLTFCLAHSHPSSLSSPPISIHIVHFTRSSASPKFSCIPCIPLSKPFFSA